MAKSRRWNVVRSTLFPLPSTCFYEKSVVRLAQRASLDGQRLAFFPGRPCAVVLRDLSRRPQACLAPAKFMPAHCFSFGSEGRGAPSARLRSPAYLVLFLEPCQSLRSLYAVLRHSAVCPRMGIRIALQNSRVRLADDTFRERSRAGCAAPVGFETHVALDAGSHRFRHKPRYFPRSQTHARWSCKRIPGRRLPGRATAWRSYRAGQPGGLVPASSHRALDALAGKNHRLSTRHNRNERSAQGRGARPPGPRAGDYCRTGRSPSKSTGARATLTPVD